MSGEWIDLGDGHAIRYVQWAPDRDLNPQHADLPDVEYIRGGRWVRA